MMAYIYALCLAIHISIDPDMTASTMKDIKVSSSEIMAFVG